jgi:hypothetical protein
MDTNDSSADGVIVRLDAYRARDRRRTTLSDMEQAIARASQAAAEKAIADAVAELGPEDGAATPCPCCSRAVGVHSRNVERTITTLHGTHTLVRDYYFCRACGTGFYPRDAALGLPADGALSLEMERRVLDFAVSGSYEECAARWNVHYPMHPLSPNQFRQVAERVGKRLEQSERRRL